MRWKSISLIVSIISFFVCIGMIFGICFYLNAVEYESVRNHEVKKQVQEDGRGNESKQNDLMVSRFHPQIRSSDDTMMESSGGEQRLNTDTKYICLEYNILTKETEEVEKKLPPMYYGMNREQFVEALEQYARVKPLEEKERGFQSLNVESFSSGKVVVKMNYRYLEPDSVFYLAVVGGEVVAFLEDKKTIYLNTGIMSQNLPESVQLQLVQMIKIYGEEELYSFLEAHSS